MRHPRTVTTFSDSGAHVSQLMDSSLQTHLLSHWVRAKQAFTLEQAVRMLTLVPATLWGFADRGLIREGMAADLVVFDPETIGAEMPEVVDDLPAGARRLVQRARGIAATVVNGEVLLRDGKHTGALPGRAAARSARANGELRVVPHMTQPPRNILLLKSHSPGVGDLLRSSAAWRALSDTFPGVQLHLAFVSREPGYFSEELIAQHHLLRSFHVLPKWPYTLDKWKIATRWFLGVARETAADLIIDCEPSGIRTALLTWLAARRLGIPTVGIAEELGRRIFYQRVAPSREAYARARGLPLPLNYTDRDFVALPRSALSGRAGRSSCAKRRWRQPFASDCARASGCPPTCPS